MGAALALAAQIIPLLPTIETGVASLVAFISNVRSAATQSKEWTPDMEKAFLDSLLAMATEHAWLTDAQIKAKG